MNKEPKIVMVGGGSVSWSPKLLNHLMLTPGLERAQYVIFDTDSKAGRKVVDFGNKLKEKREGDCTFFYTADSREAFSDADFVIITISTGGLDSMKYDLEIPEDYGIYQTVGDTVGPGGWARALRNIPVFASMAREIESYSPNAVVLNYTNPLSVLTNVFYKIGRLKTIGLCHGLFETYEALGHLFNLETPRDIKGNIGGINHFFWILDFKINGQDGYRLLRNRIGNRSLDEILQESCEEMGIKDPFRMVCSELFEKLGYLTYIEDRHTAEFLPYYLTSSRERLSKYKLERTSIKDRLELRKEQDLLLDAYIRGDKEFSDTPSIETAADIIGTFVNDKSFIDVVNLPNTGQITNLPLGTIVETLGVIDSLGFRPINAGPLPEPVLNVVLPHALNQNMLVEAGLEGNTEKALSALYNDPLCAHLSYPEIREMGMKLLKAHRSYLPQFK